MHGCKCVSNYVEYACTSRFISSGSDFDVQRVCRMVEGPGKLENFGAKVLRLYSTNYNWGVRFPRPAKAKGKTRENPSNRLRRHRNDVRG